jgi:hypothetical protein
LLKVAVTGVVLEAVGIDEPRLEAVWKPNLVVRPEEL